MEKEDLKTGNELRDRIEYLESNINKIRRNNKLQNIEIRITDHGGLRTTLVQKREKTYTDKANTNIEYLNQLYRDNVLRILENCKEELEKEFELLGN